MAAATKKVTTRSRKPNAKPDAKATTEAKPEFTEVTTRGKLDARATDVLKKLRASDEPIAKQTLAGSDVGATGMLSMLVALGFAKRMRGGRGVAYVATDALRNGK